MEELRAEYAKKSIEYDTTIQQALAKSDPSAIPRIKELNADLAKALDKMIEKLAMAKKDTPLLQRERDILIEKLRRIQKDYNGLIVNTDNLETLRRIREQEGGDTRRQLYRYLAFFFILCVGILLLILFVKGGQKKDSTATSAATPSMTPPFV